MLTGGIKQLLGISRDDKFAQIIAAMGDAFFTRRICLLGGGHHGGGGYYHGRGSVFAAERPGPAAVY